MRPVKTVLTILVALALVACGGLSKSGGGGEGSAFDKLKAMPDELTAEYDALAKPITDVDGLVGELKAIPEKFNLKADDFNGLVNAALEGKPFEPPAEMDAAARTELEVFLPKLKATKDQLVATPDGATALGQKIIESTASVPALAAQVGTESQATLANPMASAESKALATEQSNQVDKLKGDVEAQLGDLQNKVTGLPALSAPALTKLTGALPTAAP